MSEPLKDIKPVDDKAPEVIKAKRRADIIRLENSMNALPPERHIKIKTTHYFAPGIYLREVFIPKGATVTGKIHKTEHLNILSQGMLDIVTEEGSKILEASTTILSKPGTKRAAFALEDSVWTTIHATKETDVEKLEKMLVVDTFDEYLEFKESEQIEGKPCHL